MPLNKAPLGLLKLFHSFFKQDEFSMWERPPGRDMPHRGLETAPT